ncbi:MAG: hypothetical protein M0Q13_04410 [Methanothrix sp.]|nr:hypothetical protein [Methanothrix sp.]
MRPPGNRQGMQGAATKSKLTGRAAGADSIGRYACGSGAEGMSGADVRRWNQGKMIRLQAGYECKKPHY